MDGNSLENLWKSILEIVEKRLESSRAFHTWIKPVKPYSLDDRALTLEIPNTTFQRGFSSFADIIKEVCVEVAGFSPELRFVYPGEQREAKPVENNLNQGYTFENFVVGKCNRLPHAAALAVAQSPGTAYNPLFIYGGVGLGKTHLMQAISYFVSDKKSMNTAYIPCEQFVNSFIQSIQNKTTNQFRNRFRYLDVILIDDIHFIAGKEGTQEEFFHTFNTLYDARKQIILSSDRPPKEITFLEKRLVSRFEWGLVVDMQPPDFETRVAILKKKCESKNMAITDEVYFYIADNVKVNIRLLEGVLNRLFAYSSLLSRQIDIALAQEVIEGINEKEKKIITLRHILDKTSEFFHVAVNDIISKKRVKTVLLPRQIVMYLAREMTDGSLSSIAQEFGGKDHTTVIHAYKKIQKLVQTDEYFHDLVERVKKSL
jgi:chromosomal replication initiator protein